ncbi:3-hydroxyacyl-ACP dehydratase FabZ [Loigolactobacillus bifermentans]|jgi:3-hydroxyacyl-[acyl-carrier-protein] dehydratase|uniref:3-hydroxyacyl-[acyl-carrier-protein] dehydratase FabZ n=1 Tax=Loigolactobacillus bifermentans DSM 20003 TaxID=1423726 RepID=A0A0R1H1N2_9LACO|nr:(3R)-hydroxymyristoyl-[acyl-carrier-protein] dehydratase [Loigolactobacillus bifermentans DSM 20003]QGG60439.1 3-hydroxyacyl-ACP dehydratase FabZ [Loigolactobacillus bifermentans]
MLDIQEIQKILPHRYPFLLIDKVLTVTPGESVVAQKNVTINEPFFQGHFPGNPVMPGVLQLEAMAQAGAVAILTLPEFKGKVAYFGGIKKAKFRQIVRPGDVLKIEVELTKLRDQIGSGQGTIKVDDKVVCSAEFVFAIH